MSDDRRKNSEAPENAPLSPEEQEETPIELGEGLRKEHKAKKSASPKKKLILSLVALAAVVVVVGGIFLLTTLTAEPTETEDPTAASTKVQLMDREAVDIQSITLENTETTTLLRYGDATTPVYKVEGIDDAVLAKDACTSLFTNTAALSADALVVENETDLTKYGLDTPESRVTILFKDGTQTVYLVGDSVPTTKQHYLMEEGGSTIYLISNFLYGKYVMTKNDLHSYALPVVETQSGSELTVYLRNEGEWQLRQFETSTTLSAWRMLSPAELDASSETVNTLLTGIAELTLSAYDQEASDLTAFGYDADGKGAASLTYVDANGVTLHLNIGDIAADPLYRYARIDESNDIYLISTGLVDFLLNVRAEQLLDRFANIININYVDEVTVEKDGKAYTLSIQRKDVTDAEGKTTTEATYFLDGKEQEEKLFKKAYQAVIGVQIYGLTDPELVNEAAAPVLQVSYKLNNGDTDTVMQYLPYDVNNYASSKNGAIATYVRKEYVDKIWPTLEALANGTLTTD